ncbi:MAG TPA: hypothetical protein VI793_04320 [Anaerolineales bacterium]|nr:hypothetical protein [Anaerolineales bacterium]
MSLPEKTSPTFPFRPNRLSRPLSLIGLSFACVLLTVVAGAAFGGYQAGMAQREKQLLATQAVELNAQYDLAVADLAVGRYAVAAERLEYILRIDPGYPGAAQKLAQAQAALKVTPTPTFEPLPTPASLDPAEMLALAQQAYDKGDWDNTISQLTALRAIDPNFEIVKVNEMLLTAFSRRGLARILGDEMEAGIFDITQAEVFGPLDADAKNYRAWARLYLNAQSFWGVNWPQTILNLELLYALAPNFKDTTARYYQATLRYAEQLAAAGDYCAAAGQYAISQTILIDPAIADTQATAQAVCLLTPTPTATLDPALITPQPTDASGAEATPSPSP